MRHALTLALGVIVTTACCASGRTGITVAQPFAYATTPGQAVAHVYASIRSEPGDTLTGLASPAAATATLRQMLIKGGVIAMRPTREAIVLPPGRPLSLNPHGSDILLAGLREPLLAGSTIVVSFTFARAGRIDVTVPVKAPEADAPKP